MAVNSLRSRGSPAWLAHMCPVAKGLPHRESDNDQAAAPLSASAGIAKPTGTKAINEASATTRD
jgi:hypothetical protein